MDAGLATREGPIDSPPGTATKGPWTQLMLLLLAVLVVGCVAAPPSEPPSATMPGQSSTVPPSTERPASPTEPPTTAPPAERTSVPEPTETPGPSVASTPPPSIPLTPGEDPGMGQALQAVLDRAQEQRRIPGIAASVGFADGSRWAGGAGLADIAGGDEATPATRFAIGSITKTFVAALIMQLAEEAELTLDDRLARFLPDYPNASVITLRQLLSHRSGIYNYFENPAYDRQVFSQPKKAWSQREILAFVRKPYFKPGAGYHYSNTNFVLLGLIAEAVTGQPLASEIRRRFLDPLDLRDTHFQGEEPLPGSGAALGYLLLRGGHQGLHDGSRIVPNTSAATVAWAAGAMSSTVGDMARWATALYGGAVLAPESLAAMLEFQPRDAYALGTRLAGFELQRAWGHTGSLRGFTSAMWYLPDVQMTVVVSTNLGRINPNAIVARLVRASLQRLGIPVVPAPTPSPPPAAGPSVVPATPAAP